MQKEISRRSIMSAVAGLSAIVASPAMGEGIAMTATPSRAAWDAAMAQLRLADRAAEAHLNGPLKAAQKRYSSARTEPPECVVLFKPEDVSAKFAEEPAKLRWEHSSWEHVRRAYDPTRGSRWDQRHKEALDRYDAWKADNDRIADSTGWTAALAEEERLGDVLWQAEHVVIRTPAPDTAALLVKFRLIDPQNNSMDGWMGEAFEADLERLAERVA